MSKRQTRAQAASDAVQSRPVPMIGGGTAAEIQAADVALGRTGIPEWLHIGQRGIGCAECDRKMATRNARREKRNRDAAEKRARRE